MDGRMATHPSGPGVRTFACLLDLFACCFNRRGRGPPGVGSIPRGLPLNRPTSEAAGQTCQRDLAPAIELMGMDTVRGGEVADGLLLLEERLHHLGFAFRATGACAYTCVHLTNSSPIV